MNIRKNNGFTLLELLVSLSILTIVIFVGYKIIDKSTISIKNQGNINQGQLTMNDMNNYLNKDIEQSTSIELNLTTVKEDSIKSDLDKLDDEYIRFINSAQPNKSMIYTYTIMSDNKENKVISEYITNIEFKDNKYKYSVIRQDSKDVKIKFINNSILKSTNLPPFVIKGKNPYEVSMQYNGRYDKNVNHVFNVTSRYIKSEEISTPPEGPEDRPLKGDLIFKYTKKHETQNPGEYEWGKEIECNILDEKLESKSIKRNHGDYKENFNIFINTDSGYMSSHTGGDLVMPLNNESIKYITGIRILLSEGLEVRNFSIPNYSSQNLSSGKVYEFKDIYKNQYNISGNVYISKSSNIDKDNTIIVDFIYK